MQFELDVIDIAGIVVVLLGVSVLTPIMAYALHQFYMIRRAQIMRFRNSPLVIVMNILIILSVFDHGYGALAIIWKIESPMPSWIEHVIYGLCVSSIYLLIALKTWLLYFEQKYHLSVADAAWKKLINENSQGWFIRHRQTLGDWKYVLKICCIPCAFYISLCVGLRMVVAVAWAAEVMATFAGVAINYWLLHSLPLFFSCIIYYRFHSKEFKDLYRISNEIKYQCFIVVVFEVFQCGDLVFQLFTKHSASADVYRIEALINFVVATCFLFGLSIFTSTYPVYLHLMTDNGQRLSAIIAMDRRSSNLPRRRNGGIMDIGKIMRHKEGFKALMSHLLMEFSTENLLFLVELIQIKYAFQLKNRNVVIVPRFSVVDTIGTGTGLSQPKLTQQHLSIPSLQTERSGSVDGSNKRSNISLLRHSETYLNNDKYAVLDFNSSNMGNDHLGRGRISPLYQSAAPTPTKIPQSPFGFVMTGYQSAPSTPLRKQSPPFPFMLSDKPPRVTLPDKPMRVMLPDKPPSTPLADEPPMSPSIVHKFSSEETTEPALSSQPAGAEDIATEKSGNEVEEEVSVQIGDEADALDPEYSVSYGQSANEQRETSASPSTRRHTPCSQQEQMPGEGSAPPLPAQPTISSMIVSSMTRLRQMSTTNRSKSKALPKPLKVKRKLPGMYTYLFRNDGTILMKLALPPGLPPSAALEDVHKKKSLALQMEYLFNKFIKPGAVHEVNLSHGVRMPLRRFFGAERLHLKHGKVESFIFNIFDEAALQILELMVDSFGRFATTKTCRYILREMEREKEMEKSKEERSWPAAPTAVRMGSTRSEADDISIGPNTNLELPVVRHAASLHRVMHQYDITSCGGFIRAEDLEKELQNEHHR